MKIHPFIFARGGSKGLPGKNTKKLGGIPLMAYAIRIAQACPSLAPPIVSTDDQDIADVALQYGADVPFIRPTELASDTAPEWHAWQHAIDWTEANLGAFDIFVSLPATSPFRSVKDVEACVGLLQKRPEVDVVITVKAAERSPYFNMVELNDDGRAKLLIPPAGSVTRRQDAPMAYDVTTVAYAARPGFVMRHNALFEGVVAAIEIPPERALDIDTPLDFAIAEALVSMGMSAQAPSTS